MEEQEREEGVKKSVKKGVKNYVKSSVKNCVQTDPVKNSVTKRPREELRDKRAA